MTKPIISPAAEGFFAAVKLDKSQLYGHYQAVAEKLQPGGRLNVAVVYMSGSVAWSGVADEVPAGLWSQHLKAIGESQSGKVPALIISTLGNAAAVGLDRDGTIYLPENHRKPVETAVLSAFWLGVNK